MAAITAGILGGVALGAAGLSAYSSYKSNQAKAKAAQAAGDKTLAVTQQEADRTRALGERASGMIEQGAGKASNLLERYGAKARDDLTYGRDQALDAINTSSTEQLRALQGGYNTARGDLSSANTSALSSLNRGYDRAESTLGGLSSLSRYGEMAVNAGPIGSNFEQDPGYQFRLDQGNQALSRATSAAGGRLSGAALKKLSEYSQGFASNEFGQAAQRDLAMRGMQMQLGQVGYGATSDLAGMQSRRGESIAGQSNAFGANMAGLATGYGRDRSGVLGSRGSQLSGIFQQSGRDLGQQDMGMGSALGDLAYGSSVARGNALTNQGNQASNITMGSLPAYAAGVPYAGAGMDALGQFSGQVGTTAGGLLAMYGMGGGGGGGAQGGTGLMPGAANEFYGTPYAPPGYYR